MAKYLVESTSGERCIHLGVNEYMAALRHIGAHVTQVKGARPKRVELHDGTPSAFWQTVVDLGGIANKIKGPFKVSLKED